MTDTFTISSIARNFDGNPNIVSIVTSADLATITTAGYLTNEATNIQQLQNGTFQWAATDIVLISYQPLFLVNWFVYDAVNFTFIANPAAGGVTNTLASGDIFVGNGSNLAQARAVTGAITISNTGVTALAASQTSAAGQTFTNSTSSATPGTIRALKGLEVGTATTMTSGNLVGVRGEVDYVGASGGFLYGVQGKLIPTGTLSGSSWNAGVFGQFDISAATVNAGQMAPIWGDYGATSGTLTDQTGLYGIAMTNTTAAVLEGQLYLYGGAQNLMLLSTNAGLSGVTYFKDSGTGSGSWGNATPPTPSKVLKITVDGTAYYLPLVAQNT